jgi:hypothetical protein
VERGSFKSEGARATISAVVEHLLDVPRAKRWWILSACTPYIADWEVGYFRSKRANNRAHRRFRSSRLRGLIENLRFTRLGKQHSTDVRVFLGNSVPRICDFLL